MRVVSEVGPNGAYRTDVLVGDGAPLPPGCVESRPPSGLHSPRWDGSRWAEGKPAPEMLATAKHDKRAEIGVAFARECEADFPSPWVAVGVLAANPIDPRVAALKSRVGKLQSKLAAVDGAATVAEVGAVAW